MRKILGFAFVAAFLAAGTARAQGPAASGFSLGARLGYGIPMGDYAGGNAATGTPSMAMSDMFSGVIPFQLDAMYRFDRNWSVGLYLQYGFASASNSFCDALSASAGVNFSCSGRNTRFGAQLHYRFDSQGFVPWVGLGIGGEWAKLTIEALGVSADLDTSGFEYLNLQLGGDWFLSPAFRLGPYAQLSVAQYDSVSGGGASGSIANKSVHEWLQFGIKGSFDL